MADERQNVEVPFPRRFLQYDDPLVIGAGALMLGFAIGSGRLKWLSGEAGKVAGSLGTLALQCLSKSLQEHNPQIFSRRLRVTH